MTVRRGRALGLLAALVTVLAVGAVLSARSPTRGIARSSKGAAEAAPATTMVPRPSDCRDRGDPELDLAAEPAYAATYLHRATKDGCPVRLDILMLRRPGADFHCGRWPPDIMIGNPSRGVSGPYVRDPEGNFHDEALVTGFEAHATPPADAVDSPYVLDGARLVTVPDQQAIYLRYSDRTERWPLDTTPTGCA